MAKNNKKSTASQALLDLDEIKKLLKEESKNTVSALLNEAVKNSLNEAIEDVDDEETEDEEYTITDDADSNADVEENEDEKPEAEADEADDMDEEGEEESDDKSDDDSEDDEWSEFDEYKNEDGAIDFSDKEDDDAEADAALIKVYKLLKDSDQIIVKKEGNRAELKDGETGAEYVIDFGDDTSDGEVEVDKVDGPEDEESEDDNLFEMEGFGEDAPMGAESDLDPAEEDEIADMMDAATEGGNEEYDEFDAEGPNGVESMADDEFMAENKNRKARKTMKENKNKVLFEVDLGYTDSYQDKDPIEGLSNAEPAKDKNDWDAGVPKDTKKPWAGKGKSDPFKGSVNEEEEFGDEDVAATPKVKAELDADVEPMDEAIHGHNSKAVARTTTMKNQENDSPARNNSHKGKKVSGTAKAEKRPTNEATAKQLNKLMKENKALKSAANELKKLLQEAVLVNVNLGQVVKILQENTTTKNEKIDIINRFDQVKSINESKALYESISRELASSNKKVVTLEEKQFTANGTQKLNESKVYENPAISEIRKMMSRMDKAY